MKLREGEVAYLRNASEPVMSYLERLKQLDHVKLVTKASVVPVALRGFIKFVCLPPLTIISDVRADNVGSQLIIADECWAECKAVDLQRILDAVMKLAESTPSLAVFEESGAIQVKGVRNVALEEYVESYLSAKHIAFLTLVRDALVERVSARPWYLWSSHPIAYGIRELIKFGRLPVEWECLCLRGEPPKKLIALSKPLLYLGDSVLLAELPFNSSVVLTCLPVEARLREELIARALLYAC